MKQLIKTIDKLRLRNIGFRSLTEAIDTTTGQGASSGNRIRPASNLP
jgi:DNA invertase Pin-like site-specific DNA recombinase